MSSSHSETDASSPVSRSAMALARAIVPGGDRIGAASSESVRAARQLTTNIGESLGPAVFDTISGLFDYGALLSRGRRFRDLTTEQQEEQLAAWARNRLTRWPFLLYAGLMKAGRFDDAEVFDEFGVEHDKSGKPEEARWMRQVFTGDDYEDGDEIECDVVVVGTGAGGAVVGAKLAAEGYAVCFVEEGLFYRRDDFQGRAAPAHREFYRHGTVAVGNTLIPVQMGVMVGGSTAINTATCFRTPGWVLERWCEELGTDEFSEEKMRPHFEAVERKLQLQIDSPKALGRAAEIFAEGCDRLGWRHGPIERNAPGCDGQGVCDFGCPTGARRSMEKSYIPSALERGAVVFTGTRAERVLLSGDTAAGIEAVSVEGDKRLRIRARATVVACGAVPTPAFLLHQGICNSSGMLGRNLSLHPASGAAAVFDEDVRGFDSIIQGYVSDQFHRDEGFLMLGAQLPVDAGGSLLPVYGRQFSELMDRFDQVVGSTVIAWDEARPGRVRATKSGEPFITYEMTKRDARRLRAGIARLAEIYFAAGAERVYTLMPRMPVLESERQIAEIFALDLRADDFICTSWHPAGTCQMGSDPTASVIDLSHEAHDVGRLFVVDASTLPGPPAVNSQLSVMAFADRAAERIIERL